MCYTGISNKTTLVHHIHQRCVKDSSLSR